jgi:hypothetical protein
MCVINTIAQTKSYPIEEKGKINCNSDYLIDFIRFGERESIFTYESNNRIWLRLTNKSQKTLRFDAFTGQETKDFVTKDGKELNVYYDVVEKENCESKDKEIEEMPFGYRRVENYFSIDIKPERSIIFSISQKYLSINRAIYVTYTCSLNCEVEDKDKPKKAYFFVSELPKLFNAQ